MQTKKIGIMQKLLMHQNASYLWSLRLSSTSSHLNTEPDREQAWIKSRH